MTTRPSLKYVENLAGRLLGRPRRCIDLVHEVEALDRLLQDNVDCFRVHILPDLALRPSAGREPLAQDPGSATQHDREVNVHQVTVVTLQESDLGGDVQLLSQGGHIDLVALPRLVSPHDEASGTRHLIQVDDDIAAAGQDPAHGRLPGTRSAGHGHQHRGARGRTSYMSYDRG